jgi:P-type Cu+ transporter
VEAKMSALEQDGKTTILAAIDGKIACVMGIADELKSDAACALTYLQSHLGGVEVWMVTGGDSRTARAISMQLLAPDKVISEALPVRGSFGKWKSFKHKERSSPWFEMESMIRQH